MGWNDTNVGTGDTWADTAGGVYPVFLAALNERQAALGGSETPLPTPGDDDLLSIFFPLHGWGFLRRVCWEAPSQFVRRYLADAATDYTFAGSPTADTPAYHFTAVGVGAAIPFPAKAGAGGWTRKYRREIYTTAAAGTNGQRARFVTCNATLWYAVIPSDAAFETFVTTPAGQEKFGGKFFDRVSGAWVLSADQSTPADLVTETDTRPCPRFGSDVNYPTRPGDVFDGEYADEIREALNQLVRTAGYNPAYGAVGQTLQTSESFRAGWDVSFVPAVRSSGPQGSAADADAAYDAAVAGGTLTEPGAYKADLSGQWSEVSAAAPVVAPDFSGIAPPNPHGLNRDVTYWAWAGLPFDVGTVPGGTAYEYDAYGSGLAQGVWTLVGTDAATTSVSLTSPTVGSVAGAHPSPWPTAADPAVRGWQGRYPLVVVAFDVPGGFAYTYAT